MRDYSEKERAWLWLSDVLGSNVRAIEHLLFCNDGLMELFEAVRNGKTIRFPENINKTNRELLYIKSADAAIDSFIESMEKERIYAVTRDSSDYPSLLREIFDPPAVLYVKGRLRADIELPIAVIGARKSSDYGREMAEYFGRELAEHGACVVSGMALGCDSIAAKGALSSAKSDYPTIAVLGCGVDIVYPQSSGELYERIIERGAVISEFKPGKAHMKENFPQRNRIISGISKGVLVIEAGAKSGTRITTDCAHEQGRDVFAVPGRINDLSCVGTNGLIKSGAAKAVFDVDDIMFEYGFFMVRNATPVRQIDIAKLSNEQKVIYNLLILGEKTVDDLCEITEFTVSELNIYLTEMELSGIIKQLPNGKYAL